MLFTTKCPAPMYIKTYAYTSIHSYQYTVHVIPAGHSVHYMYRYMHRYIFSCGGEWLLSQDSQRIQWSEKVKYCTIGIDTVK